MRLEVVDTGHAPPEAAMLAAIREQSGVEPLGVIKTLLYRPELFGEPFSEALDVVMRGASEWSPGEREAGGWDLVKLEVLGEARTLYPDMVETLRATEVLAKEGFLPMVYCVDDPIAAKRLEDAGAVAIMPLGAPIGSGLGIQNQVTIRL